MKPVNFSSVNFTGTLLLGLLLCCSAFAQPALFKDADLKLGAQLITQNNCDTCHQKRVGGDGSAMYKPLGRINTPGFLRGMVEQCNTELNLGFFPEEVTAIAAVLNRDHYKFK
jgi:cytochrome c peroxidase